MPTMATMWLPRRSNQYGAHASLDGVTADAMMLGY